MQGADYQLRCPAGARARVVEEQEQRVFSAALLRAPVRTGQQRVGFRLVKVWHCRLSPFLVGHAADLCTPGDVFRAMFTDESGQRMNGRKALIARGDATAAVSLDV